MTFSFFIGTSIARDSRNRKETVPVPLRDLLPQLVLFVWAHKRLIFLISMGDFIVGLTVVRLDRVC